MNDQPTSEPNQLPEPVLELVAGDSPDLWRPSLEVTHAPSQVFPFVVAMRKVMKETKAAALCGSQVGLGYRFFVSNIVGHELVINPKIISLAGHRISTKEGSVTWPGQTAHVWRHWEVSAAWTGRDGNCNRTHLTGFAARVYAHMVDMMDGKCIFAPDSLPVFRSVQNQTTKSNG